MVKSRKTPHMGCIRKKPPALARVNSEAPTGHRWGWSSNRRPGVFSTSLSGTRRSIPKCEEVGWLINLAHSCSSDWTLSDIKSHSVKQKTEISPKDHYSVNVWIWDICFSISSSNWNIWFWAGVLYSLAKATVPDVKVKEWSSLPPTQAMWAICSMCVCAAHCSYVCVFCSYVRVNCLLDWWLRPVVHSCCTRMHIAYAQYRQMPWNGLLLVVVCRSHKKQMWWDRTADNWGSKGKGTRCQVCPAGGPSSTTGQSPDSGHRIQVCPQPRLGHSPDLSHECYPEVLIGLRIQEIH